MKDSKLHRIQAVFTAQGPIVRTATLREYGIYSIDIAKLISLDFITKLKTGYYTLKNESLADIEIAVSIIPNAVICLYSAAMYYELSAINKGDISLAVPSNTVRPKLPKHPPVELFVFTSRTFDIGVTTVHLENIAVRIYDKERTVCDFFRLRNQLGEDIALEVLKNYMSGSNKNLQKLLEYAAVFRIKTILKPYLEALL